MRARVFVTLKPSVFDPQGRTIAEVTEPFLIRAGLVVKDDQGGVLPGATVGALHVASGLKTDRVTDAAVPQGYGACASLLHLESRTSIFAVVKLIKRSHTDSRGNRRGWQPRSCEATRPPPRTRKVC